MHPKIPEFMAPFSFVGSSSRWIEPPFTIRGILRTLFESLLIRKDGCNKFETPAIRERPFLILGTGAEDFWQGYENSSHYFVGLRKY